MNAAALDKLFGIWGAGLLHKNAEQTGEESPTALGDGQYHTSVLAARADLIASNIRMALTVGVIFCGIVVLALWWSQVPRGYLIAWGSGIFLFTAFRLWHARLLNKSIFEGRPDRWLSSVAVLAILNGMMWGASAIFLFHGLSTIQSVILLFSMACMAGGVVAAGAHLPFAVGFLVPCLVPYIAYYLQSFGTLNKSMAIVILIYALLQLKFATNVSRAVGKSIAVGFKNEDLVGSLKAAVEVAQQAEQKFRVIADYSYSWECWFDADNKLVWTSPGSERVSGYTPEDCYALENFPIDFIHEDDKERVEMAISVSNDKVSEKDLEFRIICKDGSERWCAVVSHPAMDADGNPLGFRTSIRDVTQMKSLRSELERLAATDSLTGTLNRRAFLEQAKSEFFRAKRYDNTFSVAMFDLDNFKSINDTYGHAVGDECIKALTEIVGRRIRKSDLFARFGGEEFVLLLPETQARDSLRLCEDLRQRVEALTISSGDTEISITVSIGVAEFHLADRSLDELIARSDAAMYRAKRDGRNQVSFSVPDEGPPTINPQTGKSTTYSA